jgi:hypothetical protein
MKGDQKMEEKFTSLRVGISTRDDLIKLRVYRRETHEEVINRLINYFLETKSKEHTEEATRQ